MAAPRDLWQKPLDVDRSPVVAALKSETMSKVIFLPPARVWVGS